MNTSRKISENLYWVGVNDWNLHKFEHIMPIPQGVSYNSYLMLDEKTVLFDTMDSAFIDLFLENVEATLNGRNLDYTIIQHVEPDHVSALQLLLQKHPETTLVCTDKALRVMEQFFPTLNINDSTKAIITVKDGDVLETGNHHFTFITAPMVHWPEVIVTYESTEKILFSADAFGTFGALHGSLFADQYNFELQYLDEARRYYTNIVGKYGVQVQSLLKKAESVDIQMICSLHGPIWRQNLNYFIDKYQKWSTYTAEKDGVLIVYATMYGHTESAVDLIAGKIADKGNAVSLCNLTKTDFSYAIAETFKYKNVILAAPTYNAGLNPLMESFLHELKNHNIQNRNFAIIENGSWAPTSGKIMQSILEQAKNNTISEKMLTLRSALRDDQMADIDEFINTFLPQKSQSEIQNKDLNVQDTLNKIGYGLYVLTAKDGTKDNGCIINTVMQITNQPAQIAISVNKLNYTHDIILRTGLFNISILTEATPFKVFEHFGFQSGRNVNKFESCKSENRTQNGILYIPKYTNGIISGKVLQTIDMGTHTIFLASVEETINLSEEKTLSYAYYHENTKPQPQPITSGKSGWVCKVCGYVHEGDELPEDFICPWCKHGTEDFEKL